eukprot:9173_1
MAGKFYGRVKFDPWLIVGQIVFLQTIFYITAGAVLVLSGLFMGSTISMFLLFDYRSMDAKNSSGWIPMVTFFVVVPFCSFSIHRVVERVRKCLDFTATLYIIHLVLCWLYGGFPTKFEWWFVNGTGIVVMTLLSEWLCMRSESEPIPVVHRDLRNEIDIELEPLAGARLSSSPLSSVVAKRSVSEIV